jgi:hypothetical protein
LIKKNNKKQKRIKRKQDAMDENPDLAERQKQIDEKKYRESTRDREVSRAKEKNLKTKSTIIADRS